MKTIFLLLALVLCARSEDANKKVETQNKDKRQTEEGAPHLVYRTARKQEQVAPVEENQEEDKGLRDPQEYRPGQVFSVNAQELLELQPERKAPLSNNQQLQQLYANPQQEQRQNVQHFYYLEPQLSRQVAYQPSHAVIARPSYSSNGGEASVGAALAVSDTGANSAESLDRELLAFLGHQLRQDDGRPQTFTQLQQTPQPHLSTQNSVPQYQQVDIPYVPKPSKKPTKLRPKVQITPTPTSAAPQQYLIETTNVQQQQHQQQQQQQFRPITQSQRVPQTLRYVPIQSAPTALQQTLYERPESQGLKIVPAPKLQQLNPQYNYRIQYQQEASPKQFRIIETPRPQPIRQEQPRLLASNERPVTYLKRFQEPEKLRAASDQNVQEGLSSVQRPTQIPDQYYLRPVYRSNEQRPRYELQGMALRPMEQSRNIDAVKTPLSAIYVSKNITPKKVLRPLIRLDQSSKVEQAQREQAYRIDPQQHSGTEQVNVEQQTQSLEEQRAHLPPPRNNKAYTPEEFAALLAAGYSVTPVPVGQENHQVAQSRSASEAITVQQRRPVYSRRHQYLPLRGDDAP